MGRERRARRLLADTEAAEDAVEDVVGDDGADDLAQLIDGLAEVDRDELVAAAQEEGLGGGLEGLAGVAEAFATARAGAGDRVAIGGIAPEGCCDGGSQ